MVQNTAFLIKEYSRTNHRGQSRHTQQEAGFIAAFTSLYKVDQKSVAHSSGSIYKEHQSKSGSGFTLIFYLENTSYKMNSFYSIDELLCLGLKNVGENVCISKKASLYGISKMIIGSNVRIDDFCILSGHIELGNYIHIAAYSALYGGTEGIFISDYANVSSRVSIYSISDDYSGESMSNPMIPNKYKKVKNAPVFIGKHVIIGSTSVVLPGTHLAEGSAFGSFSFINKDSEAWSINAGIPFKKIKDRSKKLLDYERDLNKDLSSDLNCRGGG